MKRQSLIGMIAAFALVSGCAIRQNLDSVAFHPVNKTQTGDAPVDKDSSKGTKYCQPANDGTFTNGEPVVQGGTEADGVAWAEGGGCVTRPIREVWAVLNNLELMCWKETDRFTADRQINPTPDFTHLYSVTYYKNTPIGAINFTLQWYHGIGKGTFDSPDEINISYQRVKGTSMIPIWHGGVSLIKVTDSVTSISVRNDFLARGISVSANVGKAHDALMEIIDKARSGEPDWARLEDGLKGQPAPQPTPIPAPIPIPTPDQTPATQN